jgi:transcriptional antiterminator RfaH
MTLNSDEISQTSWYVVHTKPRQEERALRHLQNQHYHCFLPLTKAEKIRPSGLVVVDEPMFTRYLFIRLNEHTQDWSPIRSTQGVLSLVRFGMYPAKVPPDLINFLQQAPAAEVRKLFEPGDRIQVKNGAFTGLEGVFKGKSGEARAYILIEMLGKTHKLDLSLAELQLVV